MCSTIIQPLQISPFIFSCFSASEPSVATVQERLMISKIVNHNFKSYAGTQVLGPFHKVRFFKSLIIYWLLNVKIISKCGTVICEYQFVYSTEIVKELKKFKLYLLDKVLLNCFNKVEPKLLCISSEPLYTVEPNHLPCTLRISPV